MTRSSLVLALAGLLFACDAVVGVHDVTLDDGGADACASGACIFTDLASGARHTCAVRRDGNVFCWGTNAVGQLGVAKSGADSICWSSDACRWVPVQVDVAGATRVGGGLSFGCTLGPSAAVRCWGDNYYGQRGVDPAAILPCDDASASPCLEVPTTVPLPPVAIADISLGSATACALTGTGSGGDVYCWGTDFAGVCGVTSSPAPQPPTTRVPLGMNATRVAVGGDEGGVFPASNHACAVLQDKTVACWGNNFRGDLGHPHGAAGDQVGGVCVSDAAAACNATPTAIGGGIGDAVDLAVGNGASCLRRQDGTVWCWGSNGLGLSGTGDAFDTADHPVPAQKPLPKPIRLLRMGFDTAFAVDVDGGLWAWGKDMQNALGDGEPHHAPCEGGVPCVVRPVSISLAQGVLTVAPGLEHTAALLQDGSVWLWGSNAAGALGHQPGTGGDVDCGAGPCALSPVPMPLPLP